MALIGVHVPDATVTDQLMPWLNSSDMIVDLRRLHPEPAVLMVNGYANLGDDGAVGVPVLTKPVQPAKPLAQVGALLGKRRKAAYRHASMASRARLAISGNWSARWRALALAAVPRITRPLMPWKIAASRNRLNAT